MKKFYIIGIISIVLLIIIMPHTIYGVENRETEEQIDANTEIGVTYKGYVNNDGMSKWYSNDAEMGDIEKQSGLNAINISLINEPSNASIEYQVLTDDKNGGRVWNDWVKDGELAGNEQNWRKSME